MAIDSGLPDEFPPTPQPPDLSREAIRFLADVAADPLSTTVSRYQRLNLSRRRGNAIRQHLDEHGLIEAVSLATRSGQVVLCDLTDLGRAVCGSVGVDPGARTRPGLEHSYWVAKATEYFENSGYELTAEHRIEGDGVVDLVGARPGERMAIEIETGKSDIQTNLRKLATAGFDRVILIATCPAAVTACQQAIRDAAAPKAVELLTWLDIS
jgi:hypothetical protein